LIPAKFTASHRGIWWSFCKGFY